MDYDKLEEYLQLREQKAILIEMLPKLSKKEQTQAINLIKAQEAEIKKKAEK